MFAELLARSCFSFLRGASHPEELVDEAHRLGLSAITIVDRDGIYGVVRAYRRYLELLRENETTAGAEGVGATKPAPLRYCFGAELSLAAASVDLHLPVPLLPEHAALTVGLLVQTAAGYQNLCRLLTKGHEGREKGVCASSLVDLAAHHEGLFALLIAPEHPDRVSEEATGQLVEVLARVHDGKVAVALYRHRDGLDRARENWARTWSERMGWPIVATARPAYHHPSRKPLSDVLHCIRRGITLDQAGSELDGSSERFLRTDAQMRILFKGHPEWVDESGRIARTLKFELSELQYQFPCELEPGQSADQRLDQLTWEGAKRFFPDGMPAPLEAQVRKELALIRKIKVAPYFLSTRDVVQIARDKRILCQGRGSAANSAVCYLLGITAVDPSRSNLLFERFLSEERAEPPDIDVDFEHERREEVIQAIYERYGRERAAMVSEIISYRRKSALREVGKVFGLSLEQIDRLSGCVNYWSDTESLERSLKEAGFDLNDARLRQIIALASQLRGFPRHLSIHVGGFVLSAAPLYAVAPVEPARMENRTVIPWDKDDIDTLGFFKVDVLGLGMLTAIRKALTLIVESGGLANVALSSESSVQPTSPPPVTCVPAFDVQDYFARVPSEDPKTYEMICRAETVGVFQIESRAQMSMLPRLKPREFYDLVIQVAIVRPGPIQGGMVHPYLRRRAHQEEARAPHPTLEAILGRTLGVPLFQEQVMQIAIEGAGYSGGQADQLRRDMAAWKKHGKLLNHRQRLLEGFAKTGIPKDFAEALFEQIKGFGEYGFPESHASSFAHLVYVSSWQKAHYPAHFCAALLNSQPLGFYAPTTLVRDAQKHGVVVRDVCVLASQWDCTLEPLGGNEKDKIRSQAVGCHRALRLGLRLIKGLSEKVAREIVEKRAQPFKSLSELRRRVQIKENELQALAESGALEAIESGRQNALWKTRVPQTPGLFAEVEATEPKVLLPDMRPAEQLVLDYARKGLSVGDHPLRYYRKRLQKKGAVRAADLIYLRKGTHVTLGGLVLNRQRPATASGVVFMTLEDETGLVNLIVRATTFDQYERVARHSALLLVEGVLERDAPPKKSLAEHPSTPDPIDAEQPTPVAVIHVLVQTMQRLKDGVPRPTRASESADLEKKEDPGAVQLHKLSRNFH